MKIGTTTHCIFMLIGDEETVGGFHTTMSGFLRLLGHEIVWEIEPKEEEKLLEKVEVIN